MNVLSAVPTAGTADTGRNYEPKSSSSLSLRVQPEAAAAVGCEAPSGFSQLDTTISEVEAVCDQINTLLRGGAGGGGVTKEAEELGERLLAVTKQALSGLKALCNQGARQEATGPVCLTQHAAMPPDLVQEVDDLLASPLPEVPSAAPVVPAPTRFNNDENIAPPLASPVVPQPGSAALEAQRECTPVTTSSSGPSSRPAPLEDDTPPCVDHLGLSRATRQLIMNSTPVHRPAPTTAATTGESSLLSTPKAFVDPQQPQESFVPSPVFRTGIKLKPPSTAVRGDSGPSSSSHRCHTASSHASSSSEPSPLLFEPKSVDKRGVRRSLLPPRALDGGASSSRRSSLSTLEGKSPTTSSVSHITTRRTHSSRHAGSSAASGDPRARAGYHPHSGLMDDDEEEESDDDLPPAASHLLSFNKTSRAPPAPVGAATPLLSTVPRKLAFPGSADRLTATATLAASTSSRQRLGSMAEALGPDDSFYPDLPSHEASFHYVRPEPASPAPPPRSPRPHTSPYHLRSLTKERRMLDQDATSPARPDRDDVTARPAKVTTPRRRSSGTARSPGSGLMGTRKSPRLAAKAAASLLQDDEEEERSGPARGLGLGGDLEGEEQQQQSASEPSTQSQAPAAKCVKGAADVGEDEYKQAPTFIRMQVTRETLNDAIASLNAYLVSRGKDQLEPLPMEKVVVIIGQGERSRTVLLSLIHLKRIDMSMGRNSLRTYRWWR